MSEFFTHSFFHKFHWGYNALIVNDFQIWHDSCMGYLSAAV